MPNEKVLSEKKIIVEALTEKLKSAGGVLVDYSGITVAEDTQLRRSMREANVEYTVIKNTLTRFAANNVGFEALDPFLNGTTALAVSVDDPIASAKVVSEYAKMPNSKIKIKIGFVSGNLITAEEVNALAALPSKEVLLAQVLGTMMAPVTGFATVLNANIRGLAIALNAIAEQKSA